MHLERAKIFINASVLTLTALACFAFSSVANAQAAGNKDEFQPGKVFAKIGIGTNLVEHGLTQSDSGPALQSTLGYKWDQFRMGLWGSNVKFKDGDDDTINLRLFAVYKFVFTSNADLSARYDFNRYYNGGHRNGAITGLDLNLYTYHVLYDLIENWEGSEYGLTRYAFSKEWVSPSDVSFELTVGYNMVGVNDLSNFFDVRAGIGAKVAEIKYELIGTYNSNAGQFDGQGDPFIFLNFSASF